MRYCRVTTIVRVACVCVIACIAGMHPLHAQGEGLFGSSDIPFTVSAETAVYTDYVWRGFLLDDDPVIQPSASLGLYGVTVSFWSSFDIVEDDGVDGDEVDVAVDYTYEHDHFTLSVGNTWYTFPPADADSQEVYLGGSINVPIREDLTLSPSLTWYYDYGDIGDGGGKGHYIVAGLGHSIPLADSGLSVDLSGHVGYNHELFIEGDGGDCGIGAGLTIPLYAGCTFSPGVYYSLPFGDLEDSDDGNQDDELYAGAAFTFTYE